MAPVSHLVRQTLELRLKALLTAILEFDKSVDATLLGRHDLTDLWLVGRNWLSTNGYKVAEDARLDQTERLIAAFHEIDPSGDLFRFAISRQSAFSKQKSYDRVGLNLDVLSAEFEAADRLLGHWEAALIRKIIAAEMKWEFDPYFDVDDFPRREP